MRDIIAAKLKKSQRIDELDAEVFFVKNLNIHRCVLMASLRGKARSTSGQEIREIIRKYHRASWFRGMGFGTVFEVDCVAEACGRFKDEIDVRNDRKGTWQWCILHSTADQVCVGYHTWTHGSTTEIFQAILRRLCDEGYDVNDHKAQMDRFFRFATKWTPHGWLIRQYEEIFPRVHNQ